MCAGACVCCCVDDDNDDDDDVLVLCALCDVDEGEMMCTSLVCAS